MLAAERHVDRQLIGPLDARQTARLEALLSLHAGTNISALAWVRQPEGIAGHRSFAGIVERLEHLRSIGLDPSLIAPVHPERIRQLRASGARLSAQHLRTLRPARRRAILVATVLETAATLSDAAASMFERLIGKLFRRAETREQSALKRDRRTINAKVRLFARLGEALIAARADGADPMAAVEAVIGWDDLGGEVREARELVRPDGPDPAAVVALAAPLLRRVSPLFLSAFTFHAVPACRSLLAAVELVRELHAGTRRKVPLDTPVSFARRSWRAGLVREGAIDRRAFELCVLIELRDRLRAGDIWIEGSRAFRSVEDQLLPRPVVRTMREAGPLPLAVPDDPRAWLADRRIRMARRMAEVAAKAERDALEDVRLDGGRPRISPLRAVTPHEAEALVARLYRSLPNVRITELLLEVDRRTGFCNAFTHLSNGRTIEDRRVLLTAILADATNLGATRMADACALVTRHQLAWIAAWHLREDSYGRALATIVDAQHRLPLARLFGDGTSSSSDGQNFPLDRRAEATGDVNPHKGSEPAVAFYTHVSDRYAPFHSKVISASAGEAAHVLDGLLHHAADLTITEHHTDGGGVSDHVFALCHLFGFRFAPRIPNIARRKLHPFADIPVPAALEPLVGSRIDENLIAAHWDDVVRLGLSIRTGTVAPSAMLRRLGSYPRQSGLALALREIGRIERTLFTLDWIERPEERRKATRELNKGEAENALKRAVFFHRTGRLRDRSLQAQSHRAGGLNLVAAAIVLWNTINLQGAVAAAMTSDDPPDPNLLRHLSPLGWQHINLTGDYVWNDPLEPRATA